MFKYFKVKYFPVHFCVRHGSMWSRDAGI